MKTPFPESFTKDYTLCDEIGRGRFGVVHRCVSTTTGETFAAKCIDKHRLLNSNDALDARCLETEPKILHLLSPHPQILQIRGLHDSDSHLIIITELCQPSTLYDHLTTHSSEPDARRVISQLISALAHCHRHGIAHRDVKPENVLFDSRSDHVKLSDFGSAEWFGEKMRGVVGTPYYVAPEVLVGGEYNEKVDVWSVGVILYVMLAGVPPFYGKNVEETFRAVLRGNLRFPTSVFESVSPAVKDLIRKMLCKDVSRRFSAEQVLRHPWITNSVAES